MRIKREKKKKVTKMTTSIAHKKWDILKGKEKKE
jgi:hypothetical protein